MCLLLLLTGAGCRAAADRSSQPNTLHDRTSLSEKFDESSAAPDRPLRFISRARSLPVTNDSAPESLAEALALAAARNPSIQAAKRRVEAAAHRIPQAASLKDPMIDVEGWPYYPHVPQMVGGRMTSDVMVSQEVPWFGKRRERASAAAAEVTAARAKLAAVEQQVAEQTKIAWIEISYAAKALALIRRDRQILDDLLRAAEARYQTGTASQQEVLRLRVEQSGIRSQELRLTQTSEQAQAELLRLLHLPPDTELNISGDAQTADVQADLESLFRKAAEARPELREMLAEIHRNRHVTRSAQLESYPDVTLKMGWGAMTTSGAMSPVADGIDNVSMGFGMNVPINRARLRGAVREAEANAAASTKEYEQLRDEIQRDVRQLFVQTASQRETNKLLLESIIPETEQALTAAVRGYEVGETEFADVIAVWRELLQFHLLQIQQESQLHQTLASLERAVGAPVE